MCECNLSDMKGKDFSPPIHVDTKQEHKLIYHDDKGKQTVINNGFLMPDVEYNHSATMVVENFEGFKKARIFIFGEI